MSVRNVEEEINRFLKGEEPEVLCLMGQWGAGKTFAWNQYLAKAKSGKTISLKRYSYVSLFGQNSLDDLKYSIFENTIGIDQVGKEVDLSITDRIKTFATNWRKGIGIADATPWLKDFAPLATRSFFLTVRKQIVCIDDLERVGDELSTKDILGLISFLKDQRGCKVVLLLNDEALGKAASKIFTDQLEKVVDVEMRFEPTPSEAASIGIDKLTPFSGELAKLCIALQIVNIRVIRKIQRLALRLRALLSGHDKRIFESGLPSIALFGWIKYQPKSAPSIKFIKENGSLVYRIGLNNNVKQTDEERRWQALLSDINFINFDELDELLWQSVSKGYFDPMTVESMAIKLDKKFALQDKDNSFAASWEKYHNSFLNDEKDVLDGMFTAFKKGVESITPNNLDGTVVLFRKFKRGKEADKMIAYYMKNRNEPRNFYDPAQSLFLKLEDAKLAQAFATKLRSFKDTRTPQEILINIARSHSWNPEDISTLTQVSSNDYFKMFKKLRGSDLRIAAAEALKFKQYGGASADMVKISVSAEKALKRIGKENKLNRERVRSYGVTI